MTEFERAKRALEAAANGQPHSAKDLAMALRMSANLEPEEELPAAKPIDSFKFTPTQKRVAKLLVKGWRDKDIAEYNGITLKTAKNHVGAIMRKMKLHSRVQVAILLRGDSD